MQKSLTTPITVAVAQRLAADFGTPVYVYDEQGIRATAQQLNAAFAWAKDYKNYFAVKATPTPAILKILHDEGMGFDCSSRAELLMVQRMGISGADVFYTSNNTPREDFELAIDMGATVNIDDLTQVPVFVNALAGRQLARVAVRYNPGDLKDGNAIIGKPTEAKYGMRLDQLSEAFTQLQQQNIAEFGLHTMVASNELQPEYFGETAQILLNAVNEVEAKTGVQIRCINLGGGFGLNYRPDQAPFDVVAASKEIQHVLAASGKDMQIFTENGRYVTGPHGYLVSRVCYVMEKYKTYIGLDASMQNLMRPGMYGAYHHLSIIGKEFMPETDVFDVVGSLCENNDKFAIDRPLPAMEPGDLVVIHDAGAHGHSMGFNYNGMLRSAEVVLRGNGTLELIRRAETTEDYIQTIVWPAVDRQC